MLTFESILLNAQVTWLVHVWRDAFMCDWTDSYVAGLMHMWHDSFMCDMTHSMTNSHARHGTFESVLLNAQVAWLVHVWHDSFMCDSTDSYVAGLMYVWHDSFICVTWLIHVWYASFMRGVWKHFAQCSGEMTHSYVAWRIHMWHDVFICDMTYSYVTWRIHMWHDVFICDMTYSYVTWHIFEWRYSIMCGVWGYFAQVRLFSHPRQAIPKRCICTGHDSYIYVTWRICTWYGVAPISRLLKVIGLFCKRALQKRRYSAKETYNFKEPTNRSHPIWLIHTDRCPLRAWHNSSICDRIIVCDMIHSHVKWIIHMCFPLRAFCSMLYGVALISRLLNGIGFCKRAL